MGRKLAIYKERSLHDTSCPHLSAWCVWFTADTCKWSFPTSLALIRQEELWRVQTIAYVRMTSYRTYKWTLTNTIMVFGIKPDISKCLTLLEILSFAVFFVLRGDPGVCHSDSWWECQRTWQIINHSPEPYAPHNIITYNIIGFLIIFCKIPLNDLSRYLSRLEIV